MRIVFAGTPEFSVPCLQALISADSLDVVGVVSQPDRRSGRGMRLTPSPVKQAAMQEGIDVITPESLRNNPEAMAWLQAKQPDVLVVVAFGMILPRPWLDAAGIAPVNVHASLLPRWRGAAPIERALLAGDDETGVCIMRMEEGLDTGPVYTSSSVPITDKTTAADLRLRLSEAGARLLIETLPAINSGLRPKPQPDAGVTYAKKLQNEERVIDWHQPAAAIDRLVRCFSPQPGARVMADGRWLKIIAGHVAEGRASKGAGRVENVVDGLDVACGDGVLYRIVQLQPEGKRAMPAADFLRGARLQVGDRLG